MTIGPRQAASFWQAVTDCLIHLYSIPDATARERVATLFRRSSTLSAGLEPGQRWLAEMIYHAEPINLAAELAGMPVPTAEADLLLYQRILARVESDGPEPQSFPAVTAAWTLLAEDASARKKPVGR